jgi:hypothetical protein
MLVATSGAFGAAFWYAHLTNEQLSTTKEHFRTDERAWIGLEVSKPILKAPANGKFSAAC